MLSFFIKKMDELSSSEQHDIFALRSEIFIVEQECIYQDIDGKDKEALHITGKKGNEIVAYARIIESGVSYPDHISIGRLMVKKKTQKKSTRTRTTICLFTLPRRAKPKRINKNIGPILSRKLL
jgi:ElaA protein